MPYLLLNDTMIKDTPMGSQVVFDRMSRLCHIQVEGRELFANLFVFEMQDFDVIWGMDWPSSHHARVDCREKIVYFEIT